MITTKTCSTCKSEKPVSDFYKHPRQSLGVSHKCKQCTRQYVKEWRKQTIEVRRAKDNERDKNPERYAKKCEYNKRWVENNLEKKRVANRFWMSVAAGKNEPWPVCAVPECDKKPQAHHPDYSRPFDVVWLCASHHRQAHLLVKQEAA